MTTKMSPVEQRHRRRAAQPSRTQTSLYKYFPVRRSTRECKSVLKHREEEELHQKILDGAEDGLRVIETEVKGRGVVTTRPFARGEFVCEYAGELIGEKEAKQREEQYSQDPSVGCYMYFFNHKTSKWCVDATKETGRLGRLVNHSRTQPNVITRTIEVHSVPHLCLIASRNIDTDEELLYDYGERRKEVMEHLPWLGE